MISTNHIPMVDPEQKWGSSGSFRGSPQGAERRKCGVTMPPIYSLVMSNVECHVQLLVYLSLTVNLIRNEKFRLLASALLQIVSILLCIEREDS